MAKGGVVRMSRRDVDVGRAMEGGVEGGHWRVVGLEGGC